METERLRASHPPDLARAADLLRTGHLVAFPTETVYGLGANALSPAAVEQIFAAKQRPHWDPLIVHIAHRAMLPAIAFASPVAERLIEAFWPGPLTLLLPRTPAIPDSVTAGRPLVGIRMPAHPVALELIRQAGVPVAAPSANRFGRTSPTSAAHVLADLDTRIAAVLDAGPTSIGLESTVVEVQPGAIVIYRPGAITEAMLEAAAHLPVRFYIPNNPSEISASPGISLRHYAPRARLLLISLQPATPESTLTDALNGLHPASVGLMLPNGWHSGAVSVLFPWGPWDNPATLAARLFAGLRALDDAGVQTILCPLPPGPGLPAAIRDRLTRAARA